MSLNQKEEKDRTREDVVMQVVRTRSQRKEVLDTFAVVPEMKLVPSY